MTKVHKETIHCVRCGHNGEFDHWDLADVGDTPGLREKLFNDDFFVYTCPECGFRTFVMYSTVYMDPGHSFAIAFDFRPNEGFDYTPLRISEFEGLDGFITRYVTGHDRLKEKVLILEQGLNDVAIERMKYMMTHIVRPEMHAKGYELRFEGVNPDAWSFSDLGKMTFSYENEDEETLLMSVPMDLYYEYCLACELDPRMHPVGCICVDNGWMSKQLK